MKIKLILLLLLWTQSTYALVGAGGYIPFANSMQTDADGSANLIGLNPFIVFHYPFEIGGNHKFVPELGLVFNTGTTDNYSKKTVFLLYNFQWHFDSDFSAKYGLGTFLTQIKGDGEAVVLNNGSTTATFYQPSTNTATSYNTTLNFGGQFHFQKNYTISLDFFLFSFLSSIQRRFSYSLSLNYYY